MVKGQWLPDVNCLFHKSHHVLLIDQATQSTIIQVIENLENLLEEGAIAPGKKLNIWRKEET